MVKAFFVFGIAAVTLVASARDVTDQLENLGSPFLKRYPDSFRKGSGAYARNVWTMRAFDGRVYLGCGNSSNGGPATGCGPVPVVAYVAEDGPGMFQDALEFRTPTFARSFAYLDGYFYFGLGTEVKSHGRCTGKNSFVVEFSKDELASSAGIILRCPFKL